MSQPPPKDKEAFSLSRWSRRKHEAARAPAGAPAPAVVPAVPAVPAAAATAPAAAEVPLPAIESLTFESDFTAFLAPKVEEGMKRAALKKLFSDPRFNVMDGLDVYIDDYSKPDPMPEGMLGKLRDIYEKLAEAPTEEAATEAAPDPAAEAQLAQAPAPEPAGSPDTPDEPRG